MTLQPPSFDPQRSQDFLDQQQAYNRVGNDHAVRTSALIGGAALLAARHNHQRPQEDTGQQIGQQIGQAMAADWRKLGWLAAAVLAIIIVLMTI